jgi:Flp pilus assembly CpaF family ATPase
VNLLLVAEVRRQVSERLAERQARDEKDGEPALSVDAQRMFGRDLIADELERVDRDRLARGEPSLGSDEEAELAQRVLDELFGLGALQRYIDDPSIENILVNGHDEVWLTRADGSKTRGDAVAASDGALVDLVRTAGAWFGRTERRFDVGRPELNMELPDGSRLHAVMEVSRRPAVTIRRHGHTKVTCDDLLGLGTLDAGLASLLRALVATRRNICVVGGTNAGKTTLLRALLNEAAPQERIVVVEDEAELGLSRYPELHHDVVELEARQANIEGEGGIDMAQLVRMSLRMAPDRVIVGEVRGGEVVHMLLAMSHGQDGSMCTLHADSSRSALSKIAMYAGMADTPLSVDTTNLLLAQSLHFVIHIRRLSDGKRVVSSVREITGADGPMVQSNEIYRPRSDGRAVPYSPLQASTLESLVDAGFDDRYLQHGDGEWDR